MELSASVCSSVYHHLSATEGHAGCDSSTQETTTTTTTTQQQQQQLELARRTKRQQRACAGLRRRCYAVLKQQRTRLYILRRCVTMLLCWHEHDLSD